MKIDNVNYKEAARYCAMKYGKAEILANGIARVVPSRRFRKGTKPGVTGAGPRSKYSDDEEVWKFPDVEPTEIEKRKLIACCAEIGIRTVFTSHLYQFNGKIFLQQDGGPIGVRLSGAVARAVMGEWDATLNSILATNRLLVWLLTRYVDDCTILMNTLAMGVNWCNNCKRLAYSKDWEEEDRTTGLSNTARTMQVVERVMNSIFRNIEN